MEASRSKKAKTFEVGEKVYCYHGPLLYEAKIMKIDNSNQNEILYFIHYNGWNKNYDEWVNVKRILKFNEKNLQLKEELLNSSKSNNNSMTNKQTKPKANGQTQQIGNHSNNSNLSNGASSDTSSNNSNNTRKRKVSVSESPNETQNTNQNEESLNPRRKFEIINPNQEFDQYLTNNELKINISNNLKEILLDDWDFITHQNKITIIPCEKNVSKILNDYVLYKNKNNNTEQRASDFIEVIDDVKEYFNIMLGSQLLYKFERVQYIQMITDYPNKKMIEIYGLVHLLRLFAKLDNIISFAPIEETPLKELINFIHDILNFLETRFTEYYNDSYYTLASPEYVRQAFA